MEEFNGNEYLVHFAISKIYEICNARLSMYHPNDIYYTIPNYIYKFKQDVNIIIYNQIKKCVESFNGNLKWTQYSDNNVKHRKIIIPEIYAGKYGIGVGCEYDEFGLLRESALYGIEIYRKTCEQAIEDIPNLAKHIEAFFGI